MTDERLLLMLLTTTAVFVISAVIPAVESANILGYLATPGRSHFIVHDSLMRGLASAGHNVSMHCLPDNLLDDLKSYLSI